MEIIVRVNCPFDKTEDTQLALMLPRERVQGEMGRGRGYLRGEISGPVSFTTQRASNVPSLLC